MRISDLSSCVCSSDLYSTGYLSGEFHVPHLVAFACYIAIALGTLSGGWKIIETMGGRITKLSHHQGFAASTGGSIMVFAATLLGIPVSTTHTLTGSIIKSKARTSELQSQMPPPCTCFPLIKKICYSPNNQQAITHHNRNTK